MAATDDYRLLLRPVFSSRVDRCTSTIDVFTFEIKHVCIIYSTLDGDDGFYITRKSSSLPSPLLPSKSLIRYHLPPSTTATTPSTLRRTRVFCFRSNCSPLPSAMITQRAVKKQIHSPPGPSTRVFRDKLTDV